MPGGEAGSQGPAPAGARGLPNVVADVGAIAVTWPFVPTAPYRAYPAKAP